MTENSNKEELIRNDRQHLWHGMSKYNDKVDPTIASSGKGSWFTDINGKEYLDGVSGLWCLNLGHGLKEIADVAYEQMMNLSYFPLTMSHVPAIELSKKLNDLLGDDYTTFYSNSGSEANETAFKIARQYHSLNNQTQKQKIISRYRAYHGTTLGALSATAQANRKTNYGPDAPGFLHIPPPYSYRNIFGEGEVSDLAAAKYLEETIIWEGPETVAAFILEPIISGGGVLVPSPKYLTEVSRICKKYDVLLITDEVVSGFGRTGKMFGFMHSEDVQPDIVTMAKGLTSGYLPLGATSVRSTIYEKFKANNKNAHFRHISTYGGHPAACAVALKAIEIVEREKLVITVEGRGKTILEKLKQFESHKYVGEVRGAGFLFGIELVENKYTKEPISEETITAIIGKCKEKGLIIGRNGDTVPGFQNILIMAPPLTSTDSDICFLINTLESVLESI